MIIRMIKKLSVKSLCASALLLGLGVGSTQAQVVTASPKMTQHVSYQSHCPPPVSYAPHCPPSIVPGQPMPSIIPSPTPNGSGTQQGTDSGSTGDQGSAGGQDITTDQTMTTGDDVGTGLGAEAFAGAVGSAVGGEQDATSYIDSAIPQTQFRVRYDAQYDNPFPDRGEFFYPKCGCFRFVPAALGGDPNAPGPLGAETNIDDTQEVRSYMEYAWNDTLSTFIEVPVRWINPQVNDNTSGLGDINFGFKYAFVRTCDRIITFQTRAYAPTGDGLKGLGTEHWSIEPAILYLQQLSPSLILQGELRDWIAIDGTDFAGNLLRYGLGMGLIAYEDCRFRIIPTLEVVGWTFLDGLLFDPTVGVVNAEGDTIINAKAGVRINFGQGGGIGLMDGSDIAISYGRALTGDVHYQNILRVEFRVRY